jgi:dTDP-4-amino-4,6-dideoxygalactose transaminase
MQLLNRADTAPEHGPIHLTTLVSGHHALEMALTLLGITRGKRVLLPAVTFPACPLAALHTGADVMLADVDPTTWTLTPQIARRVAQNTQIDAVMPVALYGVPLPTVQWDDFTQDTGIPVIMDAAAAVEVQQIPRLGVVAHSLHATKPFGVGEGGVLVSRDAEIIEKSRRYSNFGTRERICHMDGSNTKMSEYHAAIGLAQINRWSDIKERRGALLQLYRRYLLPCSELLSLQHTIESAVVSLLVLRLSRPLADSLLQGLAQDGIATHRSYLPPLYRHPHLCNLAVSSTEGDIVFDEIWVERKRAYTTQSEKLLTELVGIPFHSFMDEGDVAFVVDSVKRFLDGA